jgi:hypothetical protein
MNGVLRPDMGNFVGIGILAFISVYAINRALRAMGKPTWTTSGS